MKHYLLGIILFYSLLFILIPSHTTGAYFSDSTTSTVNTFSTAAEFPQGTPSASIIINEVSPIGDVDFDWIELFNTTGNLIDLSNWKITDNNLSDTFPPGSSIPANGYAVVVASGSSVLVPITANKIELTTVTIGNGLSATGDRTQLFNSSDIKVDEMSYGTDTTIFTLPAPISVNSIRRIPNGTDTDTAADWSIGTSSIGVAN